MKYKIPKIPKEEILIIEVDNTNGDVDTTKVREFFNDNVICNLTEFECPYEIKLKTAIRVPTCSVEGANNINEFKISLKLEQILVFKNIY